MSGNIIEYNGSIASLRPMLHFGDRGNPIPEGMLPPEAMPYENSLDIELALDFFVERVRELERQREFFLKALNDNRLCPNGGCFHDGSDLDEWDCTSYDNRECWITAAKEAGG